MSFPMKYAFYLKEDLRIGYHTVQEDRIITPEEANNISNTLENCTITDKLFVDSDGNIQMYVDEIENWIEPKPNIVPLAFTGMKDSQDNEIIEGHIIHQQFYGVNNQPTRTEKGIVVWDKSTDDGLNCTGFRVIPFDDSFERHFISNSDNVTIRGHILTHDDLVPDFFDVEAYFNE